jgi:hypothetical protein
MSFGSEREGNFHHIASKSYGTHWGKIWNFSWSKVSIACSVGTGRGGLILPREVSQQSQVDSFQRIFFVGHNYSDKSY